MAEKLVKLHFNHPKMYEFLNALVDIAVKGIPFFIMYLLSSSTWMHGENAAQGVIAVIMNVILFFMTYVMGMCTYLFLLVVVQIIKLFACTYKQVIIHIRVFDLIIKFNRKKIRESGDAEALRALSFHDNVLNEKADKIDIGKDNAYQRQRERDEQNLEYAKKELEREQRDAEYYRDSADAGYRSARNGDGIFTTAEEKRNQAGKDLDTSNWDSENAASERQRIENLERKLKK
jgi:hypothetical protein